MRYDAFLCAGNEDLHLNPFMCGNGMAHTERLSIGGENGGTWEGQQYYISENKPQVCVTLPTSPSITVPQTSVYVTVRHG